MTFRLEKQSYIFIAAFPVLILVSVFFPNEAVKGPIIGALAIASIAIYIFLVERKYKKMAQYATKSGGTKRRGSGKGIPLPDGSRLKKLFAEWAWVQTAAVLGVVAVVSFTIFKLAFLPVFVTAALSFVGFGLIEYGRISKK